MDAITINGLMCLLHGEETSMILGAEELGKMMSADGSREEMREASKQLHILFEDLVDAGFTDEQAFLFISMLVKTQ